MKQNRSTGCVHCPPAPTARSLPAALLALLLAAAPAAAGADLLTLANGDRLTGTVVSLADGELAFDTAYAGRLEIAWSEVAGLASDAPLTVVYADGSRAEGVAAAGEAGRLTLAGDAAPRPFAEVVAINPPEVPPVRWSGNVSAAVTASSGNTEADRAYVEGEVVARTPEHRFTLAASVNEGEEDGQKTASRRFGRFAYDRFLSARWYLNANATATEDEFQDLDLRTTVGVALGHQFADRDDWRLAVELGASYVEEEFIASADDDYLAARWSLELSRALTDGVVLFHGHDVLQGIEDGDDRLIRTRSGVRFNVWEGLVAAAQVNWDRDASPAPGREEDDTVWALNLGYSW